VASAARSIATARARSGARGRSKTARCRRVERERDEYRKLYLLVLGVEPARALALTQQVPAHERRKPVRKPFPEDLPRVTIELVPPEVEQEGREAFEPIGAETREVLERRPASVVIVEVVKKKFVRKSERDALRTAVLVAESPELPIPRGNAGPGFLADSIVKRWQDHLPLHRLEAIYRREGIELNRSTLCTWHLELAELARPVVEAMHADALEQPYVCVDATGVLVQAPERCQTGHFWVLVAPPRHVLFQFSAAHNGAAVDRLLPDYRGTVVADAHSVYDHLYGPAPAAEAGCWSHTRKYFLDALLIDPALLREPFQWIQALFRIERTIERAPPHDRARVRREQSGPLVEHFFRWCAAQAAQALEDSPLHTAIRYALNQQAALSRFVADQGLPMHNNLSERMLRRQAVGRKNWLFVGSHDGARANTTFVSLLASCAMHRIEPWAYLRDLFCLLPGWSNKRLLDLAPVNWQATVARPDVQQQLDANIFRQVTLAAELRRSAA
jgi:transposase